VGQMGWHGTAGSTASGAGLGLGWGCAARRTGRWHCQRRPVDHRHATGSSFAVRLRLYWRKVGYDRGVHTIEAGRWGPGVQG
jgi:hypothetical protein